MNRFHRIARMALTLLLATLPSLAHARVINVTTTADELNVDGDCSLREAVQAANTNLAVDACPAGTAGADTLVLPAGSYPVAAGLAPTEALNIVGASGLTTVSGAGVSSEFLRFTVAAPFTLSGLTISTGSAFAVFIDNVGATVNLNDCKVIGFTGVWVNAGATSISSSELIGTASGLDVWQGSATVVNTTFHGSTTIGAYGAITLSNSSTARVSHSTFNGNAYAFYGIGSSALTLKDCIVAGSSQATFNTFTSTFVTSGYNLSDDALAAQLNHPTDRIGVNPLLTALASNGTTASGYRLQPTSPALNTGICTDTLGAVVANDQWGSGRPAFGGCDVGALEANPVVSVLASPELAGANCANAGTHLQIGLDWNNDGTPDTGITNRYICNGAPGTTSFATVVSVSPELAGANCASGGQRLDSGLDDGLPSGTASNGLLEAGEITSTVYLCNGAAGAAGATGATGATGANGFNSLVSVATEPAGANCANGGKKIEVGLDDGTPSGTARNGTLEAGEVDSTSYVCNGTGGSGSGGFNSLVLITDEAAGVNCGNGGKRIQSGLDDGQPSGTAGNGTLEAAEVDATNFVCNGAPGAAGAAGAAGAPGAPGANGADGKAGGCSVLGGAGGGNASLALLGLGLLVARRRRRG